MATKKKKSILEEIIRTGDNFESDRTNRLIIIVPADMSLGNIGVLNAKKFLQDRAYLFNQTRFLGTS